MATISSAPAVAGVLILDLREFISRFFNRISLLKLGTRYDVGDKPDAARKEEITSCTLETMDAYTEWPLLCVRRI